MRSFLKRSVVEREIEIVKDEKKKTASRRLSTETVWILVWLENKFERDPGCVVIFVFFPPPLD